MAYPLQPIAHTGATLTVNRETHGEGTVVLNRAAGIAVTLPASTGSGDHYRFFIGTTVTSNSTTIKVANGDDTIKGGVSLSTDIAGTNMLATGSDDTITMNGSTTGGLAGSYVDLVDVAANIWLVSGFLSTTGTEATPFSATVS